MSEYEELGLGTANDGEPIEQPVETEPETTEPPATETETQASPETEPDKPRKGGYQRKIERLERQLEQALEIVARVAPQPKVPEQRPMVDPSDPEPDPNDPRFETVADYTKAAISWSIRQDRKAAQAENERNTAQTRQTEAQRQMNTVIASAAKAHPGFQELFEDTTIPFTPAMQEVVLESDKGADLLNYFFRHPDEASQIAGLGPVAAARKIGQIEAKIATAPAPNRQTQAPKPPTPVRGTPAPGGPKDRYEEF